MRFIGFTGTQHGMKPLQKLIVRDYIATLMIASPACYFMHGDCIGADVEAADIARKLGCWIIGFPPLDTKKEAWFKSDSSAPAMEYLARNHAIVRGADVLLAAPKERMEVLRSGTWATIRYARKLGKVTRVITPMERDLSAN